MLNSLAILFIHLGSIGFVILILFLVIYIFTIDFYFCARLICCVVKIVQSYRVKCLNCELDFHRRNSKYREANINSKGIHYLLDIRKEKNLTQCITAAISTELVWCLFPSYYFIVPFRISFPSILIKMNFSLHYLFQIYVPRRKDNYIDQNELLPSSFLLNLYS